TVEKAQTRVTVRLPTVLYDRLEAFAAGRRFHRGRPQLARCVREALEEYLDRHTKRQTENIPLPRVDKTRQTPQTAEAPPQTPRTRAAARSEARKTLWTEPRAETPPLEDTDAPPPPGGERAVVSAGSRRAHPALV